jgi:aspartate/methionine/tyrosine aminotransferase
MSKVQQHADLVFNRVKGIPTLYMNMPEGSLYSIIQVDTSKFKDIPTSLAFAEKLAQEQGVVVLPTECFLSSGGFRIVLCNPPEVLNECLDRIHDFILNHLSN